MWDSLPTDPHDVRMGVTAEMIMARLVKNYQVFII